MHRANKFRNLLKSFIIFFLITAPLLSSCKVINKHEVERPFPQNTRVLLLYYSLYGSTKQVSEWVASGIDSKTDILPINDFSKVNINDYTIIVLGSAVYMENIALPMKDFLKENREKFKDKKVALFIVSGSYLISGERYLGLFERELEKKPFTTAFFGGRMVPEKLSEFHYKIMEKYWADRGQKVQFFDFTDKGEAMDFGKKIRDFIIKDPS